MTVRQRNGIGKTQQPDRTTHDRQNAQAVRSGAKTKLWLQRRSAKNLYKPILRDEMKYLCLYLFNGVYSLWYAPDCTWLRLSVSSCTLQILSAPICSELVWNPEAA